MDSDSGSPFFPPDMPPEVREQIQNAMKVNEMENSDLRHGMLKFIASLDADQLANVRRLLLATSSAGPAYWVGHLTARLEMLHNICPFCEIDHTPLDEVR